MYCKIVTEISLLIISVQRNKPVKINEQNLSKVIQYLFIKKGNYHEM